jgi:hypothetical protein
MSVYSSERKTIYLSPNQLDLLHRRRGLSNQQNVSMACAARCGKVSWQELADWLSAGGFRVEAARPLYITLAAPGIPYTRFGRLHCCGELYRLVDPPEPEDVW